MNIDKIPEWHIEMSRDCIEIQNWWKWQGDDEKGSLQSNISVGDYFSHCQSNDQVSLITSKTLNLRCAVGKEDEYSYRISHNIGGHWYHPMHSDLIQWTYFVPRVETLFVFGFEDWGKQLLSELIEIGKIRKQKNLG